MNNQLPSIIVITNLVQLEPIIINAISSRAANELQKYELTLRLAGCDLCNWMIMDLVIAMNVSTEGLSLVELVLKVCSCHGIYPYLKIPSYSGRKHFEINLDSGEVGTNRFIH